MKSAILKNFNIIIDIEKYTKLRHDFHKIPEIGFKEFQTSDYIIQTLRAIPNFEKLSKITRVGDTGFFIDIHGTSKESKSKSQLIALRADIDALPLSEQTGVDYKSTHEGMAHACGHDGHITILIATIEYYLNNIDKVPSDFCVRFIFQPAEEGKGGAASMIEGGCLVGADEIYGLHNVTMFKLGEIGLVEGAIMAGIGLFEITITGTGGHGSTPHKCNSPITIGSLIIQLLNQIPSQQIDSKDRCVVTVGCFQSGEAHNVIPEKAIIRGTFRSLSYENTDNLIKKITEVCEGVRNLYNAESIKVAFNTKVGDVTLNHKNPTEVVNKIASKYFTVNSKDLPMMASEDFSFYQHKVPGCFFMLGGGDETHDKIIHSPYFDFNDKSIPYGVEMFIRIIEEKSGISLI
jgi:amidohydrolase